MNLVLSVALMTLCGSLGALFFKRGAANVSGLRSLLTSPRLWLGGCCYLAGAALNVLLLRGHAYVWSLALSAALLHARVTAQELLGVAAVCLGVFLLTR